MIIRNSFIHYSESFLKLAIPHVFMSSKNWNERCANVYIQGKKIFPILNKNFDKDNLFKRK